MIQFMAKELCFCLLGLCRDFANPGIPQAVALASLDQVPLASAKRYLLQDVQILPLSRLSLFTRDPRKYHAGVVHGLKTTWYACTLGRLMLALLRIMHL